MAFQIQITGMDELSRQQFVTEVIVERSLYEHTRARVTLRWHEHTRYDQRQAAHLAAQILNCSINVFWKDNDLAQHTPCFHGYIEKATAARDAAASQLTLCCVAYSRRTDLVPRFRAFQATTLQDIARQIAGSEPLIKIVGAADLDLPITLSVQYGETNFAYLSRMLHAWGVPLSVRDLSGEVLLGSRGAESGELFPDVGFGWTEVSFLGALPALPEMDPGAGSCGGGLAGALREHVGQFLGQLPGTAAGYHATPDAPGIHEKVFSAAAQTDTSGYRLLLEGAVLPFSPGEVVGFEGRQHLIHRVRITGHPQETTATQEFHLQPLTLPLAPERKPPCWPSRSVWAHVTANEHDPMQQGRLQVEFEWEALDPQPSPDRAWLHTLTPYGGGSGLQDRKAGVYAGFYSVPEVGERVLVEFVGDWDSEAVIAGVVRQQPVQPAYNPRHNKVWRTPSGNEVTLRTQPVSKLAGVRASGAAGTNTGSGTNEGKSELNVVSIKTGDRVVFQSAVDTSKDEESVVLRCPGVGWVHLKRRKGASPVVDIHSAGRMRIQADGHLQLQGESVQILATKRGKRAKPAPPAAPAPGNPGKKPVCTKFVLDTVSHHNPDMKEAASKSVPAILAAAFRYRVTNKRQIAYMLATAEWECALKPKHEIWDPTPKQREYDRPGSPEREQLKNKPNYNPNPRDTNGDGYRYRGRGLVQITGRGNYEKFSDKLGIDLVAHPDKALDLETAARIMVQGMQKGLFTGQKLSTFLNAENDNYKGARAVVNGDPSNSDEIEKLALDYEEALSQCERERKNPPSSGKTGDPEIDKLNLDPDVAQKALELKKKAPGVKFISGRRTLEEQAGAMAQRVVEGRGYIKNTYAPSRLRDKMQKWVDDHPEADTVAEIQAGLLKILKEAPEEEALGISKHLNGRAFDMVPGSAPEEAVRALQPDLFLTREDGREIWHVQF